MQLMQLLNFIKKNMHFDIVLPSMPINNDESNKSLVKTIFSKDGKIIYFSREKTPYNYSLKILLIIRTSPLYHLNLVH